MRTHCERVAPPVGAWIETMINHQWPTIFMSHPPWVRGLKHSDISGIININKVAPPVGAWIETLSISRPISAARVAPPVGAWIETHKGQQGHIPTQTSHPPWVRGLKQHNYTPVLSYT